MKQPEWFYPFLYIIPAVLFIVIYLWTHWRIDLKVPERLGLFAAVLAIGFASVEFAWICMAKNLLAALISAVVTFFLAAYVAAVQK